MSFPLYKDLTKKQEDLLKEHYCEANPLGAKIKVKSANHNTLSVKYNQKEGNKPLDGETSLKYDHNNVCVEGKAKLNNEFSLQIDYKPEEQVKDMKIVYLTKALFDGTKYTNTHDIGFEYKHANGNLKTDFKMGAKDNTLETAFVGGSGDIAGGVQSTFSLGAKRFTVYNAALYYSNAGQIFALKHLSTNKDNYELGKIVGSYFKKACDDLTVGGDVTHDVSAKKTALALGCNYKLGSGSEIKAKINSDRKLSTLFRHALGGGTTLNFSTEIDTEQLHTKKNNNDFKYGFLFEFNA